MKPLRVLLISDDKAAAEKLEKTLVSRKNPPFHCEKASRVRTAAGLLDKGGFDAAVLDLALPGGSGLDVFGEIRAQFPFLPVVVLTDDEALALEAVRKGAQDHLGKGSVEGEMVSRVVRYAVERMKMHEAMREQSLSDALTGLYNRRGFMTLALQQLRLARRNHANGLLIMADIDGLEHINDAFGYQEGDLALIRFSVVLRETFRRSDIVARIDGDGFAMLAIDAVKGSQTTIADRLKEKLHIANVLEERPYTLAANLGILYFDPATSDYELENMMRRAGEELRRAKKKKKQKAG